MSTEATPREHPDDAWPPRDTPESRMTGEGSPPVPDEPEVDRDEEDSDPDQDED